jgi:hypothetical protein
MVIAEFFLNQAFVPLNCYDTLKIGNHPDSEYFEITIMWHIFGNTVVPGAYKILLCFPANFQ